MADEDGVAGFTSPCSENALLTRCVGLGARGGFCFAILGRTVCLSQAQPSGSQLPWMAMLPSVRMALSSGWMIFLAADRA